MIESLKGVRDLLFPRRCVICEEVLSTGEKDICLECFSSLPLTYHWDIVQNNAFERMAAHLEIEAAASLFLFSDSSDYPRLMYGIKYGGRRKLGYRLGYMLGRRLAPSAEISGSGFSGIGVVAPVPLHPLRMWSRGYNQAGEIARGVADALGVPYEEHLFKRVKLTRTQTRLSGRKKATNVKGAFRLVEKAASRLSASGVAKILVVDDVMTSGSTLSECAGTAIGRFKVCVASLGFVE